MERNHLHNVQSLEQSDVQCFPHAIAGSVFRLLNDALSGQTLKHCNRRGVRQSGLARTSESRLLFRR